MMKILRRRRNLVAAVLAAVVTLGATGTDLAIEHVADQRMARTISCRLKPAGPVRAQFLDPVAGLKALTGTLGTAQIDADGIHRAGTDLNLRIVLHDVSTKGTYGAGTATATIPYASLQQRLSKGKDSTLTLGTDGTGLTLNTSAGSSGLPVTVHTRLTVTPRSLTITPTTIDLMGRQLPVSALAHLPKASAGLTSRLAPHTIKLPQLPAGTELAAAHTDPSGLSLVLALHHHTADHTQPCPAST
ncbi:DUF2993 domain-containing protein [Streptomyces sp. NPDC090052]|uniref:LmeA family phospholipid-binding protein n=1 Tax=Streptomyces sp. NPDC090052 TaxID=3365931 RepID=UPI00381B0A5A